MRHAFAVEVDSDIPLDAMHTDIIMDHIETVIYKFYLERSEHAQDVNIVMLSNINQKDSGKGVV